MNKALLTLLLTITLAACGGEPTMDMTTKATQAETLTAVLASDDLTEKNRTDVKAAVELSRWALDTARGSDKEAVMRKYVEERIHGHTGIEILEIAGWEI